MLVVIYQGKVKPNKEQDYQAAWKACTEAFKSHCGALGSTLGKTTDGEWVAISYWPSREARTATWQNLDHLPKNLQDCAQTLKDCLVSYTETCVDVIDQIKA